MDPNVNVLVHIVIGGLVGMLGQGARAIAGLKILSDWADSEGEAASDLFVLHRLIISLVIGALAGIAAVIGLGFSVVFDTTNILGIAAAGYTGADFVEAFIRRVGPPSGRVAGGQNDGPPSPPTTAASTVSAPSATSAQIKQVRYDVEHTRATQDVATAPVSSSTGIDLVTPAIVKQMFPATPLTSITNNLPFVVSGLIWADLADREMTLMALSTIRCETAGFVPISEGISRYNTKTYPFDLYEPGTSAGKKIGNTQAGDGARFKGRGFVQLTGRANYQRIGPQVGYDLLSSPDWANHPEVAGRILAQFLKNNENKIRGFLSAGDLKDARIAVNGGTHGLPDFQDAYSRGSRVLPKWTVDSPQQEPLDV